MTHADAQRTDLVLQKLAQRGNRDMRDWLALVDDTLRAILASDSQLLARFHTIRAQIDQEGTGQMRGASPVQDSKQPSGAAPISPILDSKIEGECRKVLDAIRDSITTLSTDSEPPPNLDEEIDRAIQKGYFQSWPFRLVLWGLLVVALLITGVGGLKMYDQVQAMQRLVDDARKQVDAGREQVALAKAEIASRRAEFTMLLLQGTEDMQTAKIKATAALDDSRRNYLQELATRHQEALSNIDEAGKKSAQRIEEQTSRSVGELARIEIQHKDALAQKLQTVLQKLDATKNPWIPAAIWSIARFWLIIPFALAFSLFAWINSSVRLWQNNGLWAKLALTANGLLLGVIAILLYLKH